jgi:5-methylcytosine-specific restriction endonuclease McrA
MHDRRFQPFCKCGNPRGSEKIRICKECSNAKTKAWRENNPDKAKELDARMCIKFADNYRANARRRRLEKPEEVRAKKAEYKRNFPDRVKATNAKSHTREKGRVREVRWMENHPGLATERAKQWALDNPEKARENGVASFHARRARLLAVGGRFSRIDFAKILEAHDHRCVDCGSNENLERDHGWPISKGGPNHAWNIVPRCQPHNRRKSNRIPIGEKGETGIWPHQVSEMDAINAQLSQFVFEGYP